MLPVYTKLTVIIGVDPTISNFIAISAQFNFSFWPDFYLPFRLRNIWSFYWPRTKHIPTSRLTCSASSADHDSEVVSDMKEFEPFPITINVRSPSHKFHSHDICMVIYIELTACISSCRIYFDFDGWFSWIIWKFSWY